MQGSEALLWWLPTVCVVAVTILAAVLVERRRLWMVLAGGVVLTGLSLWQQAASNIERRREAEQLQDLSNRIEALAKPAPKPEPVPASTQTAKPAPTQAAAKPASNEASNAALDQAAKPSADQATKPASDQAAKPNSDQAPTQSAEQGSSEGTSGSSAAVTALQDRVKGLEDQIAALRERYQNRTIDDAKAARLVEALRPLAGTLAVVSCAAGDVESFAYAERIARVLRNAGWDIRGPETTQIFGDRPAIPVGVYVPDGRNPDAARALIDTFTKADVPVQAGIAPSEGIPNPVMVELYVPKKP